MFRKQHTIDTGSAPLNVEATIDSERTTFTAYINNLSIRGHALHLDRTREAFIDAVTAAAQCPTVEDDDHLTTELNDFVKSNTLLDPK